jgi:hypothetical protein
MFSHDPDGAEERSMERSRPEEQPEFTKRTWSAPVLEQIEMHSTASGNANHLTERTFQNSRNRS